MVKLTPYARLCLSLSVLIFIGCLVLMLPGMTRQRPLTWLESLFTSTSAICVTGLVVRSTGNDFSFAGQVVILLLIQVGGLGFMTLSSSVLMHLRQKATLGEAAVIRESLGSVAPDDLPGLLWRCLRIVLTVEAVGAALLFARFSLDVGADGGWLRHAPHAAWAAVFHSVSAFCNAGFSIWDDSLARYADDWFVNLVMMGLIVLGGLGFFVLADVEEWLRALRRREPRRLKFQSYLVLYTTAALIVGGALLIWCGESLNPATVGNGGASRQWLVPLFQSVTARTAGFSTVNMTDMSVFSLAVLMLLMFIGASPGSCGGGIKTTTFAVLATLAFGSFRSGREPSFRGRSFGRVTVRSAIALFFAASAIITAGALFLALVEVRGMPADQAQSAFIRLAFEAVSAFGTVGLSTGITSHLSAAGKLGLVALMFIGRVGPLGLISATMRGGVRPEIRYPSEDVQIG